MSKGSLFWANASGKLGESVYYRAGGEQRNRTYVKNIKNPKSEKQVAQRFKILNLMSVFHGITSVLKVSFPDKASKRSGWNEFVSVNAGRSMAIIGPYMLANRLCVPNGLILSNGTINVNTTLAAMKIGPNGDSVSASGLEMSNALIPVDLTPYGGPNFSTATPDTLIEGAQVQQAIPAIMAYWGLPTAVKLTAVLAYYVDEGFKLAVCRAASVNTLGLPIAGGQAIPTPELGSNPVKCFALRKLNNNYMCLVPVYSLDANFNTGTFMASIIISYTDGATSKLAVSRSVMIYEPSKPEENVASQWYAPSGEMYKEIIQNYASSTSNILATGDSVPAPTGGAGESTEEGGGASIPDPVG